MTPAGTPLKQATALKEGPGRGLFDLLQLCRSARDLTVVGVGEDAAREDNAAEAVEARHDEDGVCDLAAGPAALQQQLDVLRGPGAVVALLEQRKER